MIQIKISNHLRLTLLAVGLYLVFPYLLPGQEVDLLVSPGKLSKVHSQWGGINNCNQCHTEKKKADPLKCLTCHKDLAERINNGKGYHKDKKMECIYCHPEHQGEDFKLIEWSVKEFDHEETGYPLTGLHKKIIDCDKCHTLANTVPGKKGKSYLLKDTACGDCHTDIHLKQFNKNCEACHSTDGFKGELLKFNHQTDSTYALQGKHAALACEKCHMKKKQTFPGGPGEAVLYKPISAQCTACHEDFHRGQLDNDCRKCHTLDAFKPAPGFNHQKTRFPLTGFHEGLECGKCHPRIGLTVAGEMVETIKYKPLGAVCMDCHRDFDHSRTAFVLTGKHRGQDCRACHNEKNPNTRKTRNTQAGMFECRVCHASPHPGQGQRQDCPECHTTETWRVDSW
ncbi:MAG: hypothetical protein QG657_3101 [Acidobacteriota bacterium]|nr:hypothetical protein [Acidobacteriota bacterium]